ncbi:MAG: hypothetical protein KAH05_08225 [Clostridiales bacterium]|nr:hypothetical protein [Clostridiales bacterium]
MDQEKILNLILDKLESIDNEQKLTSVKINKLEDRLDSIEVKLDSIENRLDEVENSLEKNSVDIKEFKSIHDTIKDFILSTEKAIP